MRKEFKIILLIILGFFSIVVLYNLFSGTPNTINSETGDPPFYVSLLVSWVPMLGIFVFYILFLQVFKKIIRVGERIAVALEAKVEKPQSNVDEL